MVIGFNRVWAHSLCHIPIEMPVACFVSISFIIWCKTCYSWALTSIWLNTNIDEINIGTHFCLLYIFSNSINRCNEQKNTHFEVVTVYAFPDMLLLVQAVKVIASKAGWQISERHATIAPPRGSQGNHTIALCEARPALTLFCVILTCQRLWGNTTLVYNSY